MGRMPGHLGEEKNPLFLLGIWPRVLVRPARSLVTVSTQLSWLLSVCKRVIRLMLVIIETIIHRSSV
jgi:hypothetical protein